jgi:hypothetical protein
LGLHGAGDETSLFVLQWRVRPGGLRRETSTTAATHLTTLAACRARLFGRPFVRGALRMRSTAALAGDFLLAFGAHRCETTAFFAFG